MLVYTFNKTNKWEKTEGKNNGFFYQFEFLQVSQLAMFPNDHLLGSQKSNIKYWPTNYGLTTYSLMPAHRTTHGIKQSKMLTKI